MKYLLLFLILTSNANATLPTMDEWCKFQTDCTQEMYDTFVAEANRKIDFYNRIKALPDFRRAAVLSGLNQPNMALLRKSIIQNNRLNDLILLESKSAAVTAKLKAGTDKIKARQDARIWLRNNKVGQDTAVQKLIEAMGL